MLIRYGFVQVVGSQIAIVMMCFFHISHFGPWICYGTWLTNTNIKINKTSQLSRVINKITEDLGAVLYNWFHIFVTRGQKSYTDYFKATVQFLQMSVAKKRSVQINGLVFPATCVICKTSSVNPVQLGRRRSRGKNRLGLGSSLYEGVHFAIQ